MKRQSLMNWHESEIEVEGIAIHTYHLDNGKRPIVMAHGFTDDALCWEKLAAALGEDHQIVLYDEIGHGKSSRVHKMPDPETFNQPAHLEAVISAFELDHPIIIGHSMGAATTARLAALRPHLPGAIILEDLPWIDPESEKQHASSDTKEPYYYKLVDLKKQSEDNIIAYGRQRHPRWQEDVIPAWAAAKKRFDLDYFELRPPFRPNYEKLLSNISCPALFISGDEALGGIITPAKALKALEITPHAEWAHIPDAGHCIRYEKYQPYLHVVKNFMSTLSNQ